MRPLPGNRNNKWQSSLGAQRRANDLMHCRQRISTTLTLNAGMLRLSTATMPPVCASGARSHRIAAAHTLLTPSFPQRCSTCDLEAAAGHRVHQPSSYAARCLLDAEECDFRSHIGKLTPLLRFTCLSPLTRRQTAANLALGHIMQDGLATTAAAQEVYAAAPPNTNASCPFVIASLQAKLLGQHMERQQAWPCALLSFLFLLHFYFCFYFHSRFRLNFIQIFPFLFPFYYLPFAPVRHCHAGV
jgi:hypothetical protein